MKNCNEKKRGKGVSHKQRRRQQQKKHNNKNLKISIKNLYGTNSPMDIIIWNKFTNGHKSLNNQENI